MWIKDVFDHALSRQCVETRSVEDNWCELRDRTDRQRTDGQTCSSSIRLCNTSRLLLLNWWKPWEGMAWANVRTGWDQNKKRVGGDKQKGGKNKGKWSKCWNSQKNWHSMMKYHRHRAHLEVQDKRYCTAECKYSYSFNRSMLKSSFRHWNSKTCLTCGGTCPPFFSQVSFGVGDPDARQYNLKVLPSWTSIFWGLTWTWGWVPRPLGLDSDQKNALLSERQTVKGLMREMTDINREWQ